MARPEIECKTLTPPPGLVLSQLPTLKGTVKAWEWINQELGVAFRLNHIVTAQKRGELRSSIIRHTMFFSTQDCFDFVVNTVRAARDKEDIKSLGRPQNSQPARPTD
jgi:hypothetical protein